MNSNNTSSSSFSSNSAKFDTEYEESKFVAIKRTNVKSDLIEITEDKLENILLKHLQQLGIRKSWITPFSLFVTTLLANLSATFVEKFGIKGNIWDAFFLIGTVGSGFWFVCSTIHIWINRNNSSLNNLIALIKNAKKQ